MADLSLTVNRRSHRTLADTADCYLIIETSEATKEAVAAALVSAAQHILDHGLPAQVISLHAIH